MIKLAELIRGIIRDPFTGEIHEGLTKTVDIDKAVQIITNNFNKLPGIDIANSNEIIKVGFEPSYLDHEMSSSYVYNIHDINVSKLLQLANNLGYFPSSFEYEKYNKVTKEKYSNSKLRQIMYEIEPEFLAFTFEKKYDQVIDAPELVYHITDSKYTDKIKSIGLTLKTKSKLSSHPERIYVSLKKEDAIFLFNKMKVFIPIENSILLTINTKQLNNTFYEDPNFKNKGVYTYNNIPPQAIIDIQGL
jgi:hypothetical protein